MSTENDDANFSDCDFYIAFPEMGKYEPPVICHQYIRQDKGPLKGRHVFQEQRGKKTFTKSEANKKWERLVEEFLDFHRKVISYPMPRVEVVKKEVQSSDMLAVEKELLSLSNATAPVETTAPVVQPEPELVIVEEPVDVKVVEAPAEVETTAEEPAVEEQSDLTELYEVGDTITVNDKDFEIKSLNSEKQSARCYPLTKSGKRRSKQGKEIVRTIDLTSI
jgi:hypothetical protein